MIRSLLREGGGGDHGGCCPGQGIMWGKGIVIVASKGAESPSKFFTSVPKNLSTEKVATYVIAT